jgi:hypothetical protein
MNPQGHKDRVTSRPFRVLTIAIHRFKKIITAGARSNAIRDGSFRIGSHRRSRRGERVPLFSPAIAVGVMKDEEAQMVALVHVIAVAEDPAKI